MKKYCRKWYWLAGTLALFLACSCASGAAQAAPDTQYPANPEGTANAADGRTNSDNVANDDAGIADSTAMDDGFQNASVEDQNQSALPAQRIIEILRENPDAVTQAKGTLLEILRQQGREVPVVEPTDAELYERIRSSAQLRVMISRELRASGLVTGEGDNEGDNTQDSDPLVNAAVTGQDATVTGQEDAVPRLRRRPPMQNRRAARPRPNLLPEKEANQPDVMHRPSPYKDMPSLHDLYAQVPSEERPLRRFGEDLFTRETNPPQRLPIDLPVGPDYVLGPGDTLSIDLWGSVSQQLRRVIDPEGQVALPEAGTVMVAGQTLADATKLIESSLQRQFKDVKVDVSLGRLRTVRVYVVGDVRTPGAYDISSLSTPLNALIAAGGPTARGSLRSVRHYRGKQLIREIDLYDFLLRGVRTAGERLEPGDTILVPPVGPQVAVSGSVRRPAIYELKSEASLGGVLELAGGALVSANLQQINIERIEAHEKRIMLSFKVQDASDGTKLDKALGDFPVQDGDRVSVSPIMPYSEKTVYLEGHVMRPGKYPYFKGMSVSDLVRSYRDLLPEPANRAEIIRLKQPDFHPQVIDFNLDEVLTGDDPVMLEPFDTVRILGRYELDPPKVAIEGEVLRPGKYPLAEGMRVSDLLRLAGGFKRSALRSTADLTSYSVQSGHNVMIGHSVVQLDSALGDDPKQDALLKAGDVLTIRQLSGWNDIGASVKLQGEVQYPGTYGIETGERLSSLLKRAGGFRAEAYPAGAVLEREQVREMNQKTQTALIHRIEDAQPTVKSDSAKDEAEIANSFMQQRQQIVSRLRTEPASGRMVIRISPDISRWQNTPLDVELRTGDVLLIPKRPSFVLVSGAVDNSTAITYVPGKSAGWYLARAGGPTESGDKKQIFVVRTDGSVVGRGGSSRWWTGGVLSTVMQPGDSVVVPEKIAAPSAFWKNLLDTAQITSSLAIAARVATTF